MPKNSYSGSFLYPLARACFHLDNPLLASLEVLILVSRPAQFWHFYSSCFIVVMTIFELSLRIVERLFEDYIKGLNLVLS